MAFNGGNRVALLLPNCPQFLIAEFGAWKAGATVVPLNPIYNVQVTIGGATLEKLRLAKDMLRHVVSSGDEAAILDRALGALLVELARTKFAATGKHRPAPATLPESRHVPAEVKRAVWVRDLGR